MASPNLFPPSDAVSESGLELDPGRTSPSTPAQPTSSQPESETEPNMPQISSISTNTAIGTPKLEVEESSTQNQSQSRNDYPEFAEERAASPETRKLHEGWMREAIEMAQLALRTDETPVGCVFVYQNQIVGRGMNDTNRSMNGTRHAEFVALNEMLMGSFGLKKGPGSGPGIQEVEVERETEPPIQITPSLLKECTLYVTVEPCVMCASLLRQYGIKKVYFGARNEKFGGTGGVLKIHQWDEGLTFKSNPDKAVETEGKGKEVEGEKETEKERKGRDGLTGYEVSGGWLAEEAIDLLRQYYLIGNEKAPKPHRRKKEGGEKAEEKVEGEN